MDQTIIAEVWTEEVYLSPSIRQALKGDGVGIDIGAHIGSFALYAVSKGLVREVYCFEPYPPNFRLLTRNINSNKAFAVHAFPYAVTDRVGRSRMHTSQTNTGHHSLLYGGGAGIDVETISLAEIFRRLDIERCDILKIDVEGSEYGILMGAPDWALRRVINIAMEYDISGPGDRRPQSLKEFLSASGFVIYQGSEHSDRGMMYCTRGPT